MEYSVGIFEYYANTIIIIWNLRNNLYSSGVTFDDDLNVNDERLLIWKQNNKNLQVLLFSWPIFLTI